jgi:hypothetical protein
MYCARSGSPGIKTVSAKSPGAAFMCLVAKGLFLNMAGEREILPQPDHRLATPMKKILNLFPGCHSKGAGPNFRCYNSAISTKNKSHHD